jgi:hypothetical protein
VRTSRRCRLGAISAAACSRLMSGPISGAIGDAKAITSSSSAIAKFIVAYSCSFVIASSLAATTTGGGSKGA